MKEWLKNLLFIFSLIPFAIKLPYMISVWRYSPLERNDIYIWLALPLIIFLSELLRRKAGLRDKVKTNRKLLIMAMFAFVAVWIVSMIVSINALAILAGIMIVAVAVEFRFGRRVFVSQFPAIFVAVATCPSLSYWLDYYLHLGANETSSFFIIKVSAGLAFFLLWSLRILMIGRYPRIWNMLFFGTALVALLFARIRSESIPEGDSYYLNYKLLKSGDWMGMKVPNTATDMTFFKNCPVVARRTYYDKNSNISLLVLGIDDIKSVHPIGVCLKSRGAEVLASRQIYLDLKNGRRIQINELEVGIQGERYIAYSFFSNAKFTTGDFTEFRFSSPKISKWWHYQIMTSAMPSLEAARERLKSFLNAFELPEETAAEASHLK